MWQSGAASFVTEQHLSWYSTITGLVAAAISEASMPLACSSPLSIYRLGRHQTSKSACFGMIFNITANKKQKSIQAPNSIAHFQLWIKCLHSSSALGQFTVNAANLHSVSHSCTNYTYAKQKSTALITSVTIQSC